MDKDYIQGLSREQRVTWGIQIFIRLWLSGMCRSQAAQNWTIAQLAILFEVTQAYHFRDEPHTATSLSKELSLPMQTVSRTVRELMKIGLVSQETDASDARKKYIRPTNDFFVRDAMAAIAHNFGSQWYHGWEQLDKAHGATWYYPMSECKDSTAREQIKQFEVFSKAS